MPQNTKPENEAHSFHPSILRAYDMRGVVGETLTTADARVLGLQFGTTVYEAGGSVVCVGYDGRLSSPDLEAALVEGLSLSGMVVKRVGLGPTPQLYYATKATGADAGIMVTGSHNPPTHNGFKMMLASGPFYGDAILKLGERADQGDWRVADQPGDVSDLDIEEAYLQALIEAYTGPEVSGDDLCVVWDPGNGAAGDMTIKLVEKLPGRHVVINAEIDGTFPNHHPDPTVAKNLVQLQDAVAKEGAHVGIAFDGDGDRIGAIDSRGEIIWGDQLLAIYSREVLAAQPGASIITDVKASQLAFDEIARLGGNPIMWRTGHSPIKEKMAETKAPLSGEMSGHVFFADRYFGFDDALYAGVRLLNACESGAGVDRLRDEMPVFVNTPEVRLDVPEERKFVIIDELKEMLATVPDVSVVDIDGVRVNTKDGWWLVRASNTQAALTIRCEAPDADALARLEATVTDALAASGIQYSRDGL